MRSAFLKSFTILLPLLGALPAYGATFIENFTGFTTGISTFQVGGNQQQVITTTLGSMQGAAPAINGTSVFTTIDTTNTPPVGSGNYGGGLRTTISPSTLNVGDLDSPTPSDYRIVFDIAANGFAPNSVDIFLNFRDPSNANVFSQISINQNSPEFAPFVAQLGTTNGPVSVSLNLSAFSGLPANVSTLANADRFQFQLNTRSLDANYSDDDGNVLVLDNVGIEIIPEPSRTLLTVLGLTCLLLQRRRSAARF